MHISKSSLVFFVYFFVHLGQPQIYKMNFLATLKISVFLFFFLFLSCQNSKNKQSITLILEEMQTLANTENKPVFAEIERNDEKGYTAKNIEPLTDFVIGFMEGFSGEKLGDEITISCEDETDIHCEGEENFHYDCIEKALTQCFNSGTTAAIVVQPR